MIRSGATVFQRGVLLQNIRRLNESCKTSEANDFEEVRIPVPWGHIAGKWWGRKDVQPLLGLHGWQDNAATWDTLAPLLPPDISLLALDGPGHGLSSPFQPGNPYRVTDQIFVLRNIARHFKWEKISLLAHSMGAVQSFIYASVYPEEVENLILVDAFKPLSVDPEKDINKLASGIERYLDAENLEHSKKPSYSFESMIDRLYNGMVGQSLTRESCEVLLRRGTEKSGEGYVFRRDGRLKAGRLGGWLHEFVLHMASQITCNVMFIKAVPGLVFESQETNTETLEVMKKSAKVFEYHTVEGLHHVHLNNPERVAPLIVKFLKSDSSGPSDISFQSLKNLSSGSLNFM